MVYTETVPVENVYGLSFTHNFASGSVENGTMSLDVNSSNCWLYGLGTSASPVISFLQADYGAPSGDIAISRTNGSAISGYGQIGDLSVVISDNLGGKRSIDELLQLFPIDAEMISNDGKDIPISIKPVHVFLKGSAANTGVSPTGCAASLMDMYPNPLKGNALTIQLFSARGSSISVTDLLGRVVYEKYAPMTNMTQVQLPQLEKGMYLVHVATDKGIITQKLNIINN